ncbi:hypothetical protein RhiirB3_448287 [Rhizophagus irregularis]|nr:hypothetical protein RhiirB3_448287 [Rhizophagus irregularis]
MDLRFENRFSFEGFEGKHYGRMAIKMTADDAGSTMRPSRLSSDGDLLNVILPPGRYPTLSASTLNFGSVSASTFQFESPTRAFGYANARRYDDETASDDDSEDNPMVKSYQKNLDCIFQERRILNVPYVTSALPFVPKQFISKFFLGFFFALDRCQLLLGFGSVLIGSLGSDDKSVFDFGLLSSEFDLASLDSFGDVFLELDFGLGYERDAFLDLDFGLDYERGRLPGSGFLDYERRVFWVLGRGISAISTSD